MATIRRLSDSCLLVITDTGTTLFDPGFWTFDSGVVDLDSIGDIQRVLITHEHGDHVKPEFVRWLVDRGDDLVVHGNDAVVHLLAQHDIAATSDVPTDCRAEDVLHGVIPTGATPPNRSWTITGEFTHPGDSHEPTAVGPVLALPLMAPWTSMTSALAFARSVEPRQVVPIHDFYLSDSGRRAMTGMAKAVLAQSDIELVPLDWGEGYST